MGHLLQKWAGIWKATLESYVDCFLLDSPPTVSENIGEKGKVAHFSLLQEKNTFKPMFTGIAEHPKKARKEAVQGLTVQTAEGGVSPSRTL